MAAIICVAADLTCLQVAGANAAPSTSCVNPGGTSGCFASIQAAVNAATPNTTIDVAAGAYAENVVIAQAKGLVIRGAGANLTSVDGGGAGRVIEITAARSSVTLTGMTLQNGAGTGGSAVHVPAANVTLVIEDSVIRSNPNIAVGMNLQERPTGSATIARTTFDGNGRAIEAQIRKLVLDHVVVKNHVDVVGFVVQADFSKRVDVISSEFFDNATGGIAGGDGITTIKDSTVHDNGNVDWAGGGVNAALGVLRLEGSTISGNIASSGAGVISGSRPSRIVASTISGNTAVGQGGGVYMPSPSSLVISRSTISGNAAAKGGGIIAGGKLRLSNSTVAANSATDLGGGILGSIAILDASILADNVAPIGPDCFNGVLVPRAGLVENPSDCTVSSPGSTAIVGVDPMLGPLQDNGGPTETHALLPGSPAIGVVSGSLCTGTDQRGVTRHPPCDLGAFELP